MSTFDDHLQTIHHDISIKDEDRRPYTQMFEDTKKWLMQEMCQVDPVFKEMYKGTNLVGSYPNRVRIIKPSEFDVFILMDFPFDFKIRTHPDRPGFVRIDSDEWKHHAKSRNKKIYREMFRQYKTKGLNRNKFQRWIASIIETVLSNSSFPYGYSIKHTRCAVAQNVYVTETIEPYKSISIDFVPAIKMPKEYMEPLVNQKNCYKSIYFESFVAIPKSLKGCGPKSSRRLTYQLVNPEAERDIIWDKQNLKVVYRLLKSLRNCYKLKRLKSYFLTVIFLWEMLYELVNYFQDGNLPYYWVKGFNLLSILRDEEIREYTQILLDAYERLRELSFNRSLKYRTVVEHFETRH